MTHNRWYEFTGKAGMWSPTTKICLNMDEVHCFEEYTKDTTIVVTKISPYTTLILYCAYEDFKKLLISSRGEVAVTIPSSKVAANETNLL